MIEIKDIKQLEKYYDQKTNTYIFQDNVYFRMNIEIDANIDARDIKAWNIKAWNIKAWDIDACDIDARDIDARDIDVRNIDACDINAWDIKAWNINAGEIKFYAICVAYNTFKCKSLVGIKENAKAICLDSEVFIEGEEENATK